jgi:hypothetical protein
MATIALQSELNTIFAQLRVLLVGVPSQVRRRRVSSLEFL